MWFISSLCVKWHLRPFPWRQNLWKYGDTKSPGDLQAQTSSWHSFGTAWLDIQMFLVCVIVSQWVVDTVCKSGSYCGWQQLCWHWPRWTRPAGSPDQGGYYSLLAKPPSWIRKTDYFDKLLWNMSIKPEGWMNAVEIIPPVVTDVNIVRFWVESWFSFDSANS